MPYKSAPSTGQLQPEFDSRGNVMYYRDALGVRVADAQGNPLPQSWAEAAPAFGRLHPQLGQLASGMQYAVDPAVNPQEKMRQAMMMRQATTPQSTSVADGQVIPVTWGQPQSSGQPYPSGDYEPIVANGRVVAYKDLQTGRTLSTRDVVPVTQGSPTVPEEAPAMPAAAPAPSPVKGKPAAKGAGRAKAAAAELAAMKAMGETTGGAAGGPPSPSTQQAVPMTPSGRPDYNYYADMMNAVDSNDAYYRDFVRLRNDARMAARQAQIRGERFQFVPLRDYKANRVYLVNADGTDVVLNMDDPQDQKQYQRMVSDLGIDSNRLSDWTDRSSRTLARYFMPQGMQDTTPDFGFLPRRPMVDETKAAPAMQPKEPGMPMPETQGEPSPLGLSLAKGPMLPKGQQLRMPGAGPAFSELELAAMGYRQPSAVPPATPSAPMDLPMPMERRPSGSRPADVMPTTPLPRAAQLSPMEISQRSIGSALGASQAMGQIGSAGMPERPSDEEIRRAMLAAEGQRNYEQAEQWERRLPREIPDNPLMPRPYRYSPK